MTADELIFQAEFSPKYADFREQRDKIERARREQVEAWREAEEPLVADLLAAGFVVDSVWQMYLVAPYPEAVGILLRHLSEPYPVRVREGIARALG